MKIGITNLKGGVGKTTLSINCAVCFAHMGYRVGLVDTDTNLNSVTWYDARDENLPQMEVRPCTTTEKMLEIVGRLHGDKDILIMDGTPNLGVMTSKIMGASSLLIIPIRPGANDFRALADFYNRYEDVKAIRGELPAYFLLNEYDERYLLHRAVKGRLEAYYPDIPVLKTVLKSRTAYGEAVLNGTGVYEGTDLQAKAEITALTTEILDIASKHSLI